MSKASKPRASQRAQAKRPAQTRRAPGAKVGLILVDDHAMLREGLRRKFEDCAGISIVAEAGSAEELLRTIRAVAHDVIILDVKLPDANGFSLIRKVKDCSPGTRIVVLTMYNHVRYALHALEAGADAFVVKGAPFEELFEAVQAVCASRTFVCSEIAPELMGRFRRSKQSSSIDSLSQREFEVLTMLSSGLSLKEMGARMGISEKTVSTYRTRIMDKLSLTNSTDLVRFALESGLIE